MLYNKYSSSSLQKWISLSALSVLWLWVWRGPCMYRHPQLLCCSLLCSCSESRLKKCPTFVSWRSLSRALSPLSSSFSHLQWIYLKLSVYSYDRYTNFPIFWPDSLIVLSIGTFKFLNTKCWKSFLICYLMKELTLNNNFTFHFLPLHLFRLE